MRQTAPLPDRDHVQTVLERLAVWLPAPRCELDHRNPFELLIATELSAQCTDARVNSVTPALFARYPDAAALAEADPAAVEDILHPLGFFRVKARNAIGTAKLLVRDHGGEVPQRLEALIKLPGVARKTANVVMGTAFGVATGLTIDTHAFRLSLRLGWHRQHDPVKVERVLMAVMPQAGWIDDSHRLVLFGRHRCTARSPECAGCPLRELCPVGRGGIDPHGAQGE